jgi:xanthine dehydrogenase small subunit
VLDKLPGEFIEKLTFVLPVKTDYFNFEKVSKRTHLDIASVNSAALITIRDNKIVSASISAGGVGPVPMYLAKASETLAGKELSPQSIEECIMQAQKEISPISDTRGSEKYKRLLLSQLIRLHFMSSLYLPLEKGDRKELTL